MLIRKKPEESKAFDSSGLIRLWPDRGYLEANPPSYRATSLKDTAESRALRGSYALDDWAVGPKSRPKHIMRCRLRRRQWGGGRRLLSLLRVFALIAVVLIAPPLQAVG